MNTPKTSCHDSDRTVDIEYKFGFMGNPWGELEVWPTRPILTYRRMRGAFRRRPVFLRPDQRCSVLHAVRHRAGAGLTRSFMAFLIDAYTEDEAPATKGGMDSAQCCGGPPAAGAELRQRVAPLSRHAD